MKAEIERRASYTAAVLDLFLSRPYQWIDALEIAQVGGMLASRTRISDARKIVQNRRSGDIEWNGQCRASAYRYVPVLVPTELAQAGLFSDVSSGN
jgi:hypothetical protein